MNRFTNSRRPLFFFLALTFWQAAIGGAALGQQSDTHAVEGKKSDGPLSASTFYRSGEIQDIRLEISPENWRRMHEALRKRIYVSGEFHWQGQAIQNVGIRFKGNSSSQPNLAVLP